MPELPEVETVVRDLRPLLVGRTLARVEVGRKALRKKWSRSWEANLLGKRVETIDRRGKWILIELGEPWLLVHLGMTGQFTVAAADLPRETHTHVVFTLDDANELRFRDVRRFGSVTMFPDRQKLVAFSLTTFVVNTKFIVPKSSGIRSLQDLKGRAVAATSGTNTMVETSPQWPPASVPCTTKMSTPAATWRSACSLAPTSAATGTPCLRPISII